MSPKELLEYAGRQAVQRYILKEVKKVYQSGGIEIADKHIEVMINQMLRKVRVIDGQETGISPGTQLNVDTMAEINEEALMNGKTPAIYEPVLLGISKASVETESFLSAASFQETTKVLTEAAIRSKIDPLSGLKENVIVGKKIPAGTGSKLERESTKKVYEYAEKLREERVDRNTEQEEESLFQSLLNTL